MKMIKATRLGKEYDVLVDDDFYHDGMVNIMKNGYVRIHINGKTVKLHRHVLKAKPNQIVDHINGNKLDNRMENLRIVTNGQNRANTAKDKGYSYVDGKYYVRITVNKKVISLGRFDTKDDAQKMYKIAHAYYFKEHSPYYEYYLNNKREIDIIVEKASSDKRARSVLTPEMITEIKNLYSQGLTQREVAKELGIGNTTVHKGLKL